MRDNCGRLWLLNCLLLACFLVVKCSIYKGDVAKKNLEISCVNKKDWFSLLYGCYRACLQRRLYWIFLGVKGKHLSRRNSFFFVRELFFNVEKLDGTNFWFWKEQIYNFLVQKKQVKPITLMGVKPKAMGKEDWEDLDELARSTIMLTLSKSVYFNVKDTKMSHELWEKLCDLYE